jgi:hypothetical protein
MAKGKGKKTSKAKSSVKVADLRPRKNPKGGKVTLNDISVTRTVDKSSTSL